MKAAVCAALAPITVLALLPLLACPAQGATIVVNFGDHPSAARTFPCCEEASLPCPEYVRC